MGNYRDKDSEEINERGSRGQEKRWETILLRELKEIGVVQLGKENAEKALANTLPPPAVWQDLASSVTNT